MTDAGISRDAIDREIPLVCIALAGVIDPGSDEDREIMTAGAIKDLFDIVADKPPISGSSFPDGSNQGVSTAPPEHQPGVKISPV